MTENPYPAELVDVMRRCSDEIRQLRARIAQLEPKADAYDNIAAVLRLLPREGQAFGEDLAWRLDKRIQELTAVRVDDQAELAGIEA